MLSGVPPFRRDAHLALLWAQLSEPPPRLTRLRPGLPPAVDQVMAKALAKAPGDRYPRCLDFAEALRAACLPPAEAPAGRRPPGPDPEPEPEPHPAGEAGAALVYGASYAAKDAAARLPIRPGPAGPGR